MKTEIALAFVSVILLVSLAANAYLYMEQCSFALNNGLQEQAYADLQEQLVELQSQITDLSSKTNTLQNENAYLKSQNAYLQRQILENLNNQTAFLQSENANLTATVADLRLNLPIRPNLVTRLGVTDVRNNSDSHSPFRPRLFVQGEVINTGGVTARNAKLHVTLFIGSQIVKEAYIELGNIGSLVAVHVEQDIYYDTDGPRLTSWTIIPEASS